MTNWLLVADYVLHMEKVEDNDNSWWCVDRKCKPGDRAFLYKTLKGILCYFEIIELITDQDYCKSFAMNTAKIAILNVFEKPIKSKELKAIATTKNEPFIRRNFQAKSFIIRDESLPNEILFLRKN